MSHIILLNRKMIERTSVGLYIAQDNNLANPGALEHVLEELQGSLFGHDLYPSVFEKAAALTYRIITGHIFHDGNKRTGMAAGILILEMHGYSIEGNTDVINQELVDIALGIAKKEVSEQDFLVWLISNTVQSDTSSFKWPPVELPPSSTSSTS